MAIHIRVPFAAGDRERIEARTGELRPVVAALGEPVPSPPSEVRARQIAAALAAASAPSAAAGTAVAATRRSRRAHAVAPWAAAAAVVVVIVVALASLAGRSNTHTASSSNAEVATGAGVSTTTAPTPEGAKSPDFAGTTDALESWPDLGSAATANALANLARRALPDSSTTTSASTQVTTTTVSASGSATLSARSAKVQSCLTAAGPLRPPIGQVVLRARATLARRPAAVLVYRGTVTDTGPLYVVAFDTATCEVLVDRPL